MFSSGSYPEKYTEYYRSLVKQWACHDPIARQIARSGEEEDERGSADPLNEAGFTPVPGLVHAYADRVLVMPTGQCLVNCRHCNRRHSRLSIHAVTPQRLEVWLDYLQRHPEVREVIVTGGDPLTLPLDTLATVLDALRSVASVELLRLGTRAPVVAPYLITTGLCSLLRPPASGLQPAFLLTQFNCPEECTEQAGEALVRLADAGIVTGNQMVLLRGVNDNVERIVAVNRWLLRHRCRPYYLFVSEQVRGTRHLQVPVEEARGIALALQGYSGLVQPRVVVDTPNAGGKVPL